MFKPLHSTSAVPQRTRLSFAAFGSSPSSSLSPVIQCSNSGVSVSSSAISSAESATPPSQPPPPPSGKLSEDVRGQQEKPRHPISSYFPLGYKDAAYQWWTSVTPSVAEKNVLTLVPFLREAADSVAANASDPFGTRVWRRSLVQLAGKNRALNEVCIERIGEEAEETLVMVHGYGAGLGFFYKNFEPISRLSGLRLYALDLLGMGNSSRPAFKIYAKDKEQQVIEAENWFVDALEEWRKARRIERFTLLGHSLGGYLAVSYAIKYPGHLKKLILASPVGIPADPYAVSATMPEPQVSTLENEFSQDQQAVTSPRPRQEEAVPQKAKEAGANAPKRPLPGWLVWLWDANVSPFSIVRMAGPLGPRFVSGWSSRRFNHLPPREAQALHDYAFSIFKQKGSGEYALAYLLAPGAYARRPVIDRIHEVGRQPVAPADGSSPGTRETGIPIVFMYGENDWMDVVGGLAAEQKLKEAHASALLHGAPDQRRNENGSARVVVVPEAGHHLYLDNPDYFNQVLCEELEDTIKFERQKNQTPPF